SEASVEALERHLPTTSGPATFDAIRADLAELKRLLFDPRSHRVFMAAIEASWWLDAQIEAWLGDKNAADAVSQSVPHNVTSEMGLALLDVADAIRPHPEVVAYLRQVDPDADGDVLDGLAALPGGAASRAAIRRWLDAYGARCVGEIDLTRSRWSERPATIVPLILSNVANFDPGEARRRFERGLDQAATARRSMVTRLRALPDGDAKAAEAEQRIDLVRAFIGYREYPKYGLIRRHSVYRRALMAEGARLVRAGLLQHPEEVFWLGFDELEAVARTNQAPDPSVLRARAEAFASYRSLTPPRVLTSDGEAVAGAYRRDHLPAGALVGLGVSAGVVEGRARVVAELADADLAPGDILVTAFTDPSWTPLFVAIGGLVTEVGGRMTHGAVIAREYGLPAVVAVEGATRAIRDGQRIRVDGTAGSVEILP
ncbi:MAG: PEP-utilizing enzyme, partial [Myxococcota bacterium]